MSIPFERTRAILETRAFLERLLDPKETPRVPRTIRGQAKAMFRHYPSSYEIELVHKALPMFYGPIPPFSRFRGSADTDGVIQASTKKGK